MSTPAVVGDVTEKGVNVKLAQQRSSTSGVMRANDVVDVTRTQGV